MNDRFKFRVWDKRKNDWAGQPYQFLDNDGVLLVSEYNDDIYYMAENEKYFIVEQCTGLRDKNGTLIYEGDIVSDFAYGIDIVVRFGKINFKKISKHDSSIRDVYCDCFYFEELETVKKMYVLRQIHNVPEKDWKIIGNIHENPELLK